MKVIVDSVDSAFSTIIIEGNSRIQAATVIWIEFDATSWVKTHGRYQRTSSPWKSLLKKDNKVWRTTKVVVIHHPEKQYTTKIEYNFPSWCCCIVSWVDLHYCKTSFVGLLLTLRLPFYCHSTTHKQNLKSVV